ncbi:MAG: cysteine desulfurase family protein [Bdellovibrionota bacterium]
MTPIYLDYNATTPVDPRVVEVMTPYLREHFGNPSSSGHIWGWSAERAVQKSRQHIAELLGCTALDIFFTSGSTESNNWALRGLIENHFLRNPNEKFHVLTSSVEHNSVLKPLLQMQKLFPIELEILPVNSLGLVSIEQLKQKIKPSTRLMSFIWVNNEIGSINPIEDLAQLAHENNIVFHTDATQAIGKIPVNLKNSAIDLLSVSAHKMYGPKGVGALIVRQKSGVQLEPLLCGGGQERSLRSGTLNVPGIVGLGEACRILKEEIAFEIPKSLQLQKYFWSEIQKQCPKARLNGSPLTELTQGFDKTSRSPVNLSVTFNKAFPAGGFQDPHLGVSASSACSTGSMSASHVLTGIGLSSEDAAKTLRFSFGRFTQESDLKEAVHRVSQVFESTHLNLNN